MFLNIFSKKKDSAYDALVAAFCLVSYADGKLHVAELARFIRIIARERPDMKLDEDKLVRDVIARGRILDKDFAAGKASALAAIAGIDDMATSDTILKICQIAVVADNQIVPAEENIMADIKGVLGRS